VKAGDPGARAATSRHNGTDYGDSSSPAEPHVSAARRQNVRHCQAPQAGAVASGSVELMAAGESGADARPVKCRLIGSSTGGRHDQQPGTGYSSKGAARIKRYDAVY